MSYVIRLLETAAGVKTEFDGEYVREYDPGYVHSDGYDGGLLETTADRALARRFATPYAALEYWRQSFGTRADGKPNRPLTAWTVEVMPAEAITVTVGKEIA